MQAELMKYIVMLSLFLAEECGFTPEKQAIYAAKAEVIMDGMIEASGKEGGGFKESWDSVNKDFAEKVKIEKEKIIEEFKK